jgi:hypothetical protein
MSNYAQQVLSVMTRRPWILDMQRLQKWYGLHSTCSYDKTLLSRFISQIKLINMKRLATYAKHAKVTDAIYENILPWLQNSQCHPRNPHDTITSSHVYIWNQRTRLTHIRGKNNLTTWHTWVTKETRVATFCNDYQRVESGPTLP